MQDYKSEESMIKLHFDDKKATFLHCPDASKSSLLYQFNEQFELKQSKENSKSKSMQFLVMKWQFLKLHFILNWRVEYFSLS